VGRRLTADADAKGVPTELLRSKKLATEFFQENLAPSHIWRVKSVI
jgi:hypothetical protein